MVWSVFTYSTVDRSKRRVSYGLGYFTRVSSPHTIRRRHLWRLRTNHLYVHKTNRNPYHQLLRRTRVIPARAALSTLPSSQVRADLIVGVKHARNERRSCDVLDPTRQQRYTSVRDNITGCCLNVERPETSVGCGTVSRRKLRKDGRATCDVHGRDLSVGGHRATVSRRPARAARVVLYNNNIYYVIACRSQNRRLCTPRPSVPLHPSPGAPSNFDGRRGKFNI